MKYYFNEVNPNTVIDIKVMAAGPNEIAVQSREGTKLIPLEGRDKHFEDFVRGTLLKDAPFEASVFFTKEASKMITDFTTWNRYRYVNYPLTKMGPIIPALI